MAPPPEAAIKAPPFRSTLRAADPHDVERMARRSAPGDILQTDEILKRLRLQRSTRANRMKGWARHPDDRVVDACIRSQSFRALPHHAAAAVLRIAIQRECRSFGPQRVLWSALLDTAIRMTEWRGIAVRLGGPASQAAAVATWVDEHPDDAARALGAYRARLLWSTIARTSERLPESIVDTLFEQAPDAATALADSPRFKTRSRAIWRNMRTDLEGHGDALDLIPAVAERGHSVPPTVIDGVLDGMASGRIARARGTGALARALDGHSLERRRRWMQSVDRDVLVDLIRERAVAPSALEPLFDHHRMAGQLRDTVVEWDEALKQPGVRSALARSSLPAVASRVLEFASGPEARTALRSLAATDPTAALDVLERRTTVLMDVVPREDLTALLAGGDDKVRRRTFALLATWPRDEGTCDTPDRPDRYVRS